MYGNYVRTEDADNNTASGSINMEELVELSRKYKKAKEKKVSNVTEKPVRWNTGTKVRPSQPVRMRTENRIAERYNANMKELDEDLNNSFIEDPNHKLVETPLRRRDSGSFTQTDTRVKLSSHKDNLVNREKNFDDSLIRAFQPFNLNCSEHTGTGTAALRARSKSSSPNKEGRSPDSGSFTADTAISQDIHRDHSRTDMKKTLSSALKSLGERPRIGSAMKNNEAHYNMPVRFKMNKENVPTSAIKENQSIKERLKALSGQGSEVTQTSGDMRPLDTDSQPQGSHTANSSLRTQTASKMASAPSLVRFTETNTQEDDWSRDRGERQDSTQPRHGPRDLSGGKDKAHAHTHSFIQDVLSSTGLSDHSHPAAGHPADRSRRSPVHPEVSQPSTFGQRTQSHQGMSQSRYQCHSESYRTRQDEQSNTGGQSQRNRPSQRPEQPQHIMQTPISSSRISQVDGQTPRYVHDRTPRIPGHSTEVPTYASSLSTTKKDRTMPPPSMSISRAQESFFIINGRRYKILKLIGKGGSSRVYQALDEDNTVVAIKRVDLSNAEEAQAEGYLNEINLLMKLKEEDRIVRLHDFEQDEAQDILYVVMEKGDTDLANLLKDYANHKEITPAMIKHYWTEMLNAVSVIHKRGIIHSDLKPANFLLVAGRLKLIDFGIASSVQSDKTSVMKDTQMGTFNFMSPEAIQDLSGPQYDGSGNRKPLIKISYKSDVWSLGCILYNLTYGKMPFGDIRNSVMKWQAIINPDHKISFPADNVDPLLLDVIKSCLTRDVKSRPSIDELLNHSYVTGVETVKESSEAANAARMLADLENNLAGVLSPSTFEKTRKALQNFRGKN